jgi:hypothetical protein
VLPVSAVFQSIALPIEDQRYGHMLLERLEFENGTLNVEVRPFQSDQRARVTFSDVIGITIMEDVFGCNGGQITHDGGAIGPRGLSVSEDSRTLGKVRSVTEPFRDAIEAHRHFWLNLREYQVSIVAAGDLSVELLPDNRGE